MDKLKSYVLIILAVLCVTNMIYLAIIHAELKRLKTDVQKISVSINKITEVPRIDELQIEDPLNPSPNNLQDVLNRIDKAEKNIRSDLNYRTR